LIDGGIGTVEKLGSMTPEDLEAIAGIDPGTIAAIQAAVNSYYAQFEEPAQPAPDAPGDGEYAAEPAASAERADMPAPAAAIEEPETAPGESGGSDLVESDTIKDSD
jgi:N utilization substance protein A